MIISLSNIPTKLPFEIRSKTFFRFGSEFEGVDLNWFKMKVCEKLDCLDKGKYSEVWVESLWKFISDVIDMTNILIYKIIILQI